VPATRTPTIDRVLARLGPRPTDGSCWLWPGGTNGGGYGAVGDYRADGSRCMSQVHLVVYRALVGPVPDGLVLDHTCATLRCAEPSHLEPVEHGENLRRGKHDGRCKTGRHLIADVGRYRSQCRGCRADAGLRRRSR
jgi:hypothetical protein